MNNNWKNNLDELQSQHDIIQGKLALLGSSIDEANKNKVRLFLDDCRTLQRSSQAAKQIDTARKAKTCQQEVWRTLKRLRIKLYRCRCSHF